MTYPSYLLLLLCVAVGCGQPARIATPATGTVDLSPEGWKADYDTYMAAQLDPKAAPKVASGRRGAVAVAWNGLAARAGVEALQQGGTAVDAALTTALMQVALSAGAATSYFGVMDLVYYEAATGRVYTMDAGWNAVLGEDDPLSIPGGPPMTPDGQLTDIEPSGRTALVGGFMKGVGAAHARFGRLPFVAIFEPALYVAREGMPVTEAHAEISRRRADDLRRLPQTRAALLDADGEPYAAGALFKQPALARTLAAVAEQGPDYMYGGPWGERLVAAVQADGGKMTLEDLEAYGVIWADPLAAPLGEYRVHVMPPPNRGGLMLIEAQNLAEAAGLTEAPHWSESGASLRTALTIANMGLLDFWPDERIEALYPGLVRTDSALVTPGHAEALWSRIEAGVLPSPFAEQRPTHSDVVVAADAEGNVAAISHSINTVFWGKTAIVVDGVTISDPASFQQAAVARVGPGGRLPSPSESGILTQDGKVVLGFGSMGPGMHHKPFQVLLNITRHGMTIDEAVRAPDFFFPLWDEEAGGWVVRVEEGQFPHRVLEESGLRYLEVPSEDLTVGGGGEGKWAGVSRDPETGELRAASHPRSNSAAFAY